MKLSKNEKKIAFPTSCISCILLDFVFCHILCFFFCFLIATPTQNVKFHIHQSYMGIGLPEVINPKAPTPQNGQTHSSNSSADCRRIVSVYLTILWG